MSRTKLTEEQVDRLIAADWCRCVACPVHYEKGKNGLIFDACVENGVCMKNEAKTVVDALATIAGEQVSPAHEPSSADGKAATYDDGKDPLANIPWAAVREMAKVQAYGRRKYGDFNNYRKGMEISRNISCALRHIADYQEGQDHDPESGRHHLAHAMCRLAFVLQNLHDGVAIDDRYAAWLSKNKC